MHVFRSTHLLGLQRWMRSLPEMSRERFVAWRHSRDNHNRQNRLGEALALVAAWKTFIRFLPRRLGRLAPAVLVSASMAWAVAPSWSAAPKSDDEAIHVSLFAEAPQIVTPIGMVFDHDGRLFVIESHTHLRPANYEGPRTDRIRQLIDRDGDGRCDQVTTFAQGFDAAMNLAVDADNTVYVVCARQVFALLDDDNDGVCDKRKTVLRLETSERYPHNCWLSIAISADGWMYVGRGNVAGRAYSIVGADGTTVSGYGDGGNIVRCRLDGSQLQQFATGFWNPFGLRFDLEGRLFCVDNDPDARGPNRLVHVVRDADFGYRSLYGGGGNHPYQGWDADLPGVLPIVSGTGEAPCDVLDSRRTALPADYHPSQLVTVWNEHTIEWHRLQRRGASFHSERKQLIVGDNTFRPVAMATDQQGNLFISDWVNVAYPNHKEGRIWRVSFSNGSAQNPTPSAKDRFASQHALPISRLERQVNQLLQAGSQLDTPELIRHLRRHPDPYVHHAVTVALGRPEQATSLSNLALHSDQSVRLAALLSAKRTNHAASVQMAKQFLADESREVCRAALQWIGEARLAPLRDEIDQVLQRDDLNAVLLDSYLATVRCLSPQFIADYANQVEPKSRNTYPPLPKGFARSLAADDQLPMAARILALKRIPADGLPDASMLLVQLCSGATNPLRRAAFQQLAVLSRDYNRHPAQEQLLAVARDASHDADLRADALLALAHNASTRAADVIQLAGIGERNGEPPPDSVRVEAARALRHLQLDASQLALIRRFVMSTQPDGPLENALRCQLLFCLDQPDPKRPTTLDEWHNWLAAGGSPSRGERAFRSIHARCSNCHTVNGVGGQLGPDLSQLDQSQSRKDIITSILAPSQSFAPQYQAWHVVTTDGQVHTGIQLDHKSGGAAEMFVLPGETVRFAADEIDEIYASPQSLMPAELHQSLTTYELRDIVAFLCQSSSSETSTDQFP